MGFFKNFHIEHLEHLASHEKKKIVHKKKNPNIALQITINHSMLLSNSESDKKCNSVMLLN